MKYRKKPVEVEAIRWTGDNLDEIKASVVDGTLEYWYDTAAWEVQKGPVVIGMRIKTPKSARYVHVGDYIVHGATGEYYPWRPDIFEEKYGSCVVDAVQWTGANVDEIKEFCPEVNLPKWRVKGETYVMSYHTSDGICFFRDGDYLVKEKGVYYMCRKDYFEETYEPVEASDHVKT